MIPCTTRVYGYSLFEFVVRLSSRQLDRYGFYWKAIGSKRRRVNVRVGLMTRSQLPVGRINDERSTVPHTIY